MGILDGLISGAGQAIADIGQQGMQQTQQMNLMNAQQQNQLSLIQAQSDAETARDQARIDMQQEAEADDRSNIADVIKNAGNDRSAQANALIAGGYVNEGNALANSATAASTAAAQQALEGKQGNYYDALTDLTKNKSTAVGQPKMPTPTQTNAMTNEIAKEVVANVGQDPNQPAGAAKPQPDMALANLATAVATQAHLKQVQNGQPYDPSGAATQALSALKPYADAVTQAADSVVNQQRGDKPLAGTALAQAAAPIRNQLMDASRPEVRAAITYFRTNGILPSGFGANQGSPSPKPLYRPLVDNAAATPVDSDDSAEWQSMAPVI